MADQSTFDSSCADETTICYIQRVNTERERIISILNNSQLTSTRRSVFAKYLLDDVALSDLLQSPEHIAEFFKLDGPNIVEALRQEFDGLQDLLVRKLQLSQEREDDQQRMNERAETIKKFIKDNTVPQPINKDNIDQVQANIRCRLKKEKEQLSTILAAMFQDNEDTRNMLASLVNKKIKKVEGDGYTEFPDQGSARESIRLLVTTGLFETHSENPLKVRMIDF